MFIFSTISYHLHSSCFQEPWSAEEDYALRNLVDKLGLSDWTKISKIMPTQRSAKQCRERWCYNVRPGLKKGDWSSEEDKTILTMHGILGNQWARIASALSGRTDSDVKNRINSLKRARANQALLALPPLPVDLECNGSFTDSSGSNSLCDSNHLSTNKRMKCNITNFPNENPLSHHQSNTSIEVGRK